MTEQEEMREDYLWKEEMPPLFSKTEGNEEKRGKVTEELWDGQKES